VVAAALATLAAGGLSPVAEAQQVDPDRLSAMEARSIGPAGMSGRVAAIEGVPGRSSTLYVGSATGGVWKSTDSGTTWTPIFDDQDASSIGAIAVHPANPELVWVGTGEANMRNSSGLGRGLYRSRDGGDSWEKVGLEDSEHIHRIEVHPDDPDVAYVAATGPLWADGGQRGLYRTTDGGETWERVLAGPNPRTGAVEVAMDPENPQKLFASLWEFRRWPYFFESGGPGSGLYVSHDGGDSWTEISDEEPFPGGHLGRIGLAVAPGDPSVVYALVEAETSQLLRSDDGGDSWTVVNRGEAVSDRPFYYHDLAVDPERPDRLYYIHGTLEVSTDGGRTFEGAATWGGGVHVDHHALWIDPENPDFVVDGNDGGVYISRDRADSWRFVQNLPLSQYYEIDLDMDVPYNVYGGLQDNGSWKGPTEVWAQGGIRNYHWTEIGFGDGFGALDDPENPRYGFSMSQRGFLNRWDIRTGQRKSIRPVAPSDTVDLRFNWNAPIATDPFRENTVYFGSQFVHMSTDDGLTWEVISPDLTTDDPEWQRQEQSGGLTKDVTGAENYTNLYTIAPSPVEEGVIWTGSDDGKVHVTRDRGGSWTDLTDEIPGAVPEHAWVSHIEASPHEGGTAFVVFHDYMRGDWGTYVYRVEDHGGDWTRIAGEEVQGPARVLVQDPEVPDLLYLGTEFGLQVSLDGGGSWMKWTHGMPTVPVRDLEVHPRDGDLVVGTHGRGIQVLDDVRPLRELSGDPGLLDGLHLFETPVAYVHEVAAPKVYRFDGDAMFRGENPEYGAHFTFSAAVPEPDTAAKEGPSPTAEPGGPPGEPVPVVGEETLEETRRQAAAGEAGDGEEDRDGAEGADPEAVLQVLDADSVIRTDTLEVRDGLNRAVWNLRPDGFRRPSSADGAGGPGGSPEVPAPQVLSGTYQLRVAFREDTVSRPVEVRFDPRLEVPTAERREKRRALTELGRHFETASEAVERIRETRDAVDRVLEMASAQEVEGADTLRARGGELTEALTGAEERFMGPTEEVQGIVREQETVTALLGRAYFALSSSFDAPTEAQRIRARRAVDVLREAVDRTNRILEEEVPAFRELVRDAGLSFVPEKGPVEMAE
jgi:photosystem II stability/assembly factor-like uncharacterized protein